MMMAHDSSPPPPALDPSTVAALNAALTRYVREGNHTQELQALLHQVAAEARQKGIVAERLLVMLKDIWHSIPEVRLASQREVTEQNALLQQLITRCIRQYYT